MVILETKLWPGGNPQPWLFCEISIKMLQSPVGNPNKSNYPEITITGHLVHGNTAK